MTAIRSDPSALLRKLDARSAQISVVGLGYVGLTVACALADKGFHVTGIDVDPGKVEAVSRGVYPLEASEPDLPAMVRSAVLAGTLGATQDYASCRDADIVIIAVQTPVDDVTKAPALGAFEAALRSTGANIHPGALVVIEPTIPPGTMRDVAIPLLTESSGLSPVDQFWVACCPERVMPGRLLANLIQYDRVIGGWTPEAAALAATLYRTFVTGALDEVDCLTAELVKTVENTYRDVQIAFANEVALLCEHYGADVFEVRDLVNKSPARAMHVPGAGVGGPCVPKDPWLLIANASHPGSTRIIRAARAVNDSMPIHMGELARTALAEAGRQLRGAKVLVLGYAYLENSSETRNSPSAALVAWLEEQGAEVRIHDPFVSGFDWDLEDARGGDCVIAMVAHTPYRALDLARLGARMRTRILVDGRRVFDRAAAESASWSYRCVGVGS